jgi:eukaryotic-like serine/threonine-protein kinase
MTLGPGTRMGPYEILGPIGSGGMGEVYRARDPRLGRDVAIKVLPQAFAAEPARLARFQREAQALASLNHPHIGAIFGLETTDGVTALVLELVEGETLDRRIGPAGMPLAEVLGFAVQIADALAAAHAAGIVHRDLKPANVMVTPAGSVKLLDFGLAKVTAFQGADATMTAAAPRTEEGAILGTVAYMSPEQAAGRPLDARSDIFSFGSVLFEMLAGRRAFEGDTSMSTLAAIIHEPARPASQVNARVPRELERLISRCHRKDPARRVQSTADLKVALEELRDDLEGGRLTVAAGTTATPPARPWRLTLAVAAGAIVLVAAGWLAGRAPGGVDTPVVPQYELHRMTADIGLTNDPAVAPNGSLLAYASDRERGTTRDIWVQPVAGGEPIRVTSHTADDSAPAFAPDGSRIAFRSERDGGGIYVVPALGGPERLLVPDGRDPQFSPDGQWLAYHTGGRGGDTHLHVMPAAGGPSRRLFPEARVTAGFVWSPDSTRLLFLAIGERGSVDWWVGDIAEPAAQPPRRVRVGGFISDAAVLIPQAWESERVLYTRPWGHGARLDSIRVDGETFTEDVRPLYLAADQLGRVAMDSNGRLYVSSYAAHSSIWTIPVSGPRPATGEARRLTGAAAADQLPSLSADGTRLAFISTRRPDAGAWLRDLKTGAEVALPSQPRLRSLVLSPDGDRVAYSPFGSEAAVFVVGTGGGAPRQLCGGCVSYLWSWTPEGRALIVNIPPQGLALLDAESGEVHRLVDDGQDFLWMGRVSPDGRWLAFLSWEAADRTRKVIAPFAGGQLGERSTWISASEGRYVDEESAWAHDGRTLYFVSERDGFRCFYGIGFDPDAGQVLGSPQAVLHVHGVRQSVLATTQSPSRIDVAGGQLVFPMGELQGNIYALSPASR